jgi:hypothetical protein
MVKNTPFEMLRIASPRPQGLQHCYEIPGVVWMPKLRMSRAHRKFRTLD